MGRSSNKEPPPADRAYFTGLTGKEIAGIYHAGSVRTLDAGEFMVREGEADESIFLVTAGSLKVVSTMAGKEEPVTVAVLREGSWFGSGGGAQPGGSPYSLLAAEPTTLLSIGMAAFDVLDPGARSFLCKAFSVHTSLVMRQVMGETVTVTQKNDRLVTFIGTMIGGPARDYHRMEIVQDFMNGFPRLPLFVDKLTSMLLSDMVSTAELVEYAKTDPSIVSTTLKRINSPFYSMHEKVTDFHRAVMLLGFNQIYRIALEECVFELLPKSFRTKEFHRHSILISLIGFELAVLTGIQRPAAVSTLGLIHDMGQVLLQLLKNQNRDIGYLIDGLDGAQVAAILFEKWSLPQSICGAIKYQVYAPFAPPDRIPGEYRENVALLHVAHALCDAMQGIEQEETSGIFLDQYMALLGLGGMSPGEVARTRVLPLLVRKIHILPEDMKRFIEASLPGQ